jgi:hypothetical protein
VSRNDDVIAELRAAGFGYRRLTFSWRRATAAFLASAGAAVVVLALHWLTCMAAAIGGNLAAQSGAEINLRGTGHAFTPDFRGIT